jgi:flagellar biosynthetic protein FlhB
VADKGGADKSEKPTPKRLKEGRKQGQVARSPDLAAWSTILVLSYVIPGTVSGVHDAVTTWLQGLDEVMKTPDMTQVVTSVTKLVTDAALATLPLLLVALLVSIIAGVAQGGARPYFTRLKPKASRLSLFSGIKRIVGPQGVWELVKNLIKTSVVGFTAWKMLSGMAPLLVGAGSMPLVSVAGTVATDALVLVRVAGATALVVGVADYLVSKRRIGKQMMMSRKEVRDEMKQSDGDPMVKAQIRRRAMAAAANRMMADVPQADVVLVNPTHVAVALRYQPGRGAPRVLAKGAGEVAARIRAVATENRVPMVEDIPLARALYASCDIGAEIPAEMFTAVARVLAFVMSLRSRGAHAGLHRASALALAQR